MKFILSGNAYFIFVPCSQTKDFEKVYILSTTLVIANVFGVYSQTYLRTTFTEVVKMKLGEHNRRTVIVCIS